MKHYYLFDMDGTLVDSMDAWSSAMKPPMSA
jgi:beta-phosphoglucomutase-like phosphatase (HAD superfamily)